MNLRKQKALETKKRISSVALDLFKEKCFMNVTVDEIIEKSSTSKGAFYNHFKSKHDIFLEKFIEIDTFYVEKLLPKLGQIESAEEKLKIFLYLQMEYIENVLGWDLIRTIYEQELNTERESFFLNPDRPLYHILISLLEEGQKNYEFRKDLTENEMLEILVRVTRGLIYDWCINKGSYSLKIEQENLFRVTLRGFKIYDE